MKKLSIKKNSSTQKWEVTLTPGDSVLSEFGSQKAAQRFTNEVLASGTGRWRCCVSGCNPRLNSRAEAEAHKFAKKHRVAAWPVRSKEGQAKAKARNRNGYYKKYNNRGRGYSRFYEDAEHPFSEEAVQG